MNKKLLAVLISATFSIVGCDKADVESNTPVESESSSMSKQLVQTDLDLIAKHLDIRVNHISNHITDKCVKGKTDDLCFEAQFILTANKDIPAGDWQIYYSQIAPLHNYDGELFQLSHKNGDLHTLTPTEKFKGLKQG